MPLDVGCRSRFDATGLSCRSLQRILRPRMRATLLTNAREKDRYCMLHAYSKTPCVGKRLSEPSQPFSNIHLENTHPASHFPKPAWKMATESKSALRRRRRLEQRSSSATITSGLQRARMTGCAVENTVPTSSSMPRSEALRKPQGAQATIVNAVLAALPSTPPSPVSVSSGCESQPASF